LHDLLPCQELMDFQAAAHPWSANFADEENYALEEG
jgi:hypothetical protein